MGFLIRTAFWFSLVLLALPLGAGSEDSETRQVGAVEAIIAAGAAVSDIAGMCERKPDVCETGKAAIATVGVRAREASRIAYQALETRSESTDITTTGSVELPETATRLPQEAPASR